MQGPLAKGLPLPFYAYENDAGLQLPTAVEVVIPANGKAQIVTDLYFVIPAGYYLHVESRGASAVLGVGFDLTIVDEGYRGAVNLVAWNKSATPVLVERGCVVGQVILRPYDVAEVIEITAEEFAQAPQTERGDGRIGSSGNKPRYLDATEKHFFVVEDYTDCSIWDDIILEEIFSLPSKPKGFNRPEYTLPEGNWTLSYGIHQMATEGAYKEACIPKPTFEQLPAVFCVDETGCRYKLRVRTAKEAVAFIRENL